jgi:hypothetical protein
VSQVFSKQLKATSSLSRKVGDKRRHQQEQEESKNTKPPTDQQVASTEAPPLDVHDSDEEMDEEDAEAKKKKVAEKELARKKAKELKEVKSLLQHCLASVDRTSKFDCWPRTTKPAHLVTEEDRTFASRE